ncbi:LacI family DNA-binding transcriptional regulator [Georgenia halophila]|uniref:LacI family DNA-binding transcriptional regulator n=1 Tax=Georgenia halophila TaxID=620889 RepID=A0ABP8KSX9_9MICO
MSNTTSTSNGPVTSGENGADGGQRRPSMADIARRAGVSSQTVSRVANGSPQVVEATRLRVLAAMEELGYRPNSAARALKRGDFRTIGVIMFNLSTTGNMRTLEAIAASSAAAGYAITLLPVAAPTRGQVEGAFTRLGELAVDAVIAVMEVHLLDSTSMVLPPSAHVVVVDSDADNSYTVVDTDQADGAGRAVNHLLELGHRTVHHVAGAEESYAAQRRMSAWRETLRRHGREVPAPLHGDWSADSGYAAGVRLAQDEGCTAVFVANDQMALGVLRALHEAGRHVPNEVSVVGFDNIPETSAYSPPLTTVHQDFAEVGRRCVEAAISQLHGRDTQHGRDLVPTSLVVRQSTAPPRGR